MANGKIVVHENSGELMCRFIGEDGRNESLNARTASELAKKLERYMNSFKAQVITIVYEGGRFPSSQIVIGFSVNVVGIPFAYVDHPNNTRDSVLYITSEHITSLINTMIKDSK